MWTSDSQLFLLEHFDTIYNSPSHLYHSALPLCPSSSWLYACYSLGLSKEAKVVEGLPVEWGMCSRTVLLDSSPWPLSYWNNTIAVGSMNGDVLILNATTGSQAAVLSGHTDHVKSLTFSSEGTSLVSGSDDTTIKLWDVQTGGVVRTFHGHTDKVWSISVSADHTIIASGSDDKTLRLWDIQTGVCHQIIKQEDWVSCIRFSPTDPQSLMSASSGTVQQWDINGHKVGPTYSAHQIAFSPDGTQFILYMEGHVTVQNINSGVVVAKFYMEHTHIHISPCCFSPDGKLVAVAAAYKAYVWDITGSHPHLVGTFVGHTNVITSLVFSSPSTLISAAQDGSVKFWRVGAPLTDLIVINQTSTPLTSAPNKSKNGPIPPSDLPDGVVKAWGISTSLQKGSPQTPVKDSYQSNIQLIDKKLIFVWCADGKINIWDAEKGKLLQTINISGGHVIDLRVSGDGSKVFCLYERSIQAWDIWTGEVVAKVESRPTMEITVTDGSKVWISYDDSWKTYTDGWDFGIPDSSPVELSDELPDRLCLDDTKVWEINMSKMKDIATGKVIFQLPQRFGKAVHVQWDGQYLLVSVRSKEVFVIDFSQVSL